MADTVNDRVSFEPAEEAYYRAWCEHFGIDFEAASKTLAAWSQTFEQLRRRYYETHPEVIVAMEREYANMHPLDRAMTIIARTQDMGRAQQLFRKLQEESVDVPEKLLALAAYDSQAILKKQTAPKEESRARRPGQMAASRVKESAAVPRGGRESPAGHPPSPCRRRAGDR